MVQWLRIHLPVQGTWVQSPAQEDSTRSGATKLVHCCSHAFRETDSLRRTMQIVECSLSPRRPKAESPLSQGPRPAFVKTSYSLSVLAQTHLPKFLETSLGQGKREIRSKLIHDSCVTRPDKQWTFINRPVVISR